MKGLFLNVIKSVFILIGTYIGAGFISGNEIYLFFGKYKVCGVLGLLISTIFMGIILYKIIIFSREENINNYNDLLKKIINRKIIYIIINKIMNIYFLILFCLMTSGLCNFINQQFNINKIIIYLIFLLLNVVFIKNKNNFIIKINTFVMPIILIFLVYILGISVHKNNYFPIQFEYKNNFIIPAIIYSSYNLLNLIPISITSLYRANKIKKIIIIFCSIIFLLKIIVFLILNYTENNYLNLDFPIIFFLEKIGYFYKNIYCIIIVLATVTTAISVEYALVQKNNKNLKIIIICSLLSINFTFSNLLKIVYPVFGIIGLIQLFFFLTYKKIHHFK